jgi:hypothetical protein
MKEYRARKKEENINTLRHIQNTQQNIDASLATSNRILPSQRHIHIGQQNIEKHLTSISSADN